MVTNKPPAFKAPTFTLKSTAPRIMVMHCFKFPQTVIVNAPTSLFVLKEETLRQKAKNPLPRKTMRATVTATVACPVV